MKKERKPKPEEKPRTEAEEAQWWFDHRETLEAALIEAMKTGTIRRNTAARLTLEAARNAGAAGPVESPEENGSRS